MNKKNWRHWSGALGQQGGRSMEQEPVWSAALQPVSSSHECTNAKVKVLLSFPRGRLQKVINLKQQRTFGWNKCPFLPLSFLQDPVSSSHEYTDAKVKVLLSFHWFSKLARDRSKK